MQTEVVAVVGIPYAFTDKDGKATGKGKTVSLQVESRPLIYPEELNDLGSMMIVNILRQPPLKAVFTPAYKINNYDDPRYGKQSLAPIYDMIPAPESTALPKTLNEQAIFYDIKKRNEKILRNNRNNNSNGFDW